MILPMHLQSLRSSPSTGFFVCKLKKLSNDKNLGAVAQEESDEEEFEVNEADFKSHVLENVRVPKEERKKKGKGKVETAPAPIEATDAPAKKADKVKKPSKIYLAAMAELEAERKTKQKAVMEKKPKGKNEKSKKAKR